MELFQMVAWYVGGAAVGVYVLWMFFLAVMALMRAHEAGTLSKVALYLGMPIVAVGVLIDFVVNVVVLTPLMLDVPAEWTVSQRLARIKAEEPTSWRGKMASWICTNLLDTFDPTGEHCDC